MEQRKNAGFSEHIPWIMMNPNYQTINAEAEMKDTNSIFILIKINSIKKRI